MLRRLQDLEGWAADNSSVTQDLVDRRSSHRYLDWQHNRIGVHFTRCQIERFTERGRDQTRVPSV